MTLHEKNRLLALFLDTRCWCQRAEARSADGEAVTYSDPQAAAWDVTGAVCHLFGWRRARELFLQIDRRLHARARSDTAGADAVITAMIGLQRWNDDPQTSHSALLAVLERIPISKPAQTNAVAATELDGRVRDSGNSGALPANAPGSEA